MNQNNVKKKLFDVYEHQFLKSQGEKYQVDNENVDNETLNFSQVIDSNINMENSYPIQEVIQKPYKNSISSEKSILKKSGKIEKDLVQSQFKDSKKPELSIKIDNSPQNKPDANNSQMPLNKKESELEQSLDEESFISQNDIMLYQLEQKSEKLQNNHKKKFSAKTTGDIMTSLSRNNDFSNSFQSNFQMQQRQNKSVTVPEHDLQKIQIEKRQMDISGENPMNKDSKKSLKKSIKDTTNNSIPKLTSQTKTIRFENSSFESESKFSEEDEYGKNSPSVYKKNQSAFTSLNKSLKTEYMAKFEQEDKIVQERKNIEKEKLKEKQTKFQEIMRQVKLNTFFQQTRQRLESWKFHHLGINHFKLMNDYYYKMLKNGIQPKNEYDLEREKFKTKFLSAGRKTIFNSEMLNQFLNSRPQQSNYKNHKFFKFLTTVLSDLQKGKCLSFLQKIPKMHPDHPVSVMIDIISFVLIIMMVFFINLFWSFDLKLENFQGIENLGWGILIFLVFEVIMRLNTGIIQEAKIKYEASIIMFNYKNKFMRQDFVGILCMLVILFKDGESTWVDFIAQLLLNFKIRSYLHLKDQLEHRLSMHGVGSHIIQLVQMIWNILTLSHFIALLWHGLQLYQINNGVTDSWAETNLLLEDNWKVRYLKSMFWANGLIMLIGAPGETPVEVLFKTISLFLTVGIFAYILENISQLLRQLTKDSQQYKIDLEIINRYMNNKNLDSSTQINVRKHLEHCYKSIQEININTQASQVLQHLPFYLRSRIRDEINGSIIKKFELLIDNFSKQTISSMLNIMQEVTYVSQDIIFYQDRSQESFMYIILTGEVELFYMSANAKNENKHTHKIKTLQQGEIFGQDEFFTGLSHSYSAKATKFSNIVKIKRDQFINLLCTNQRDYEKFCVIKDQLIQNGSSKYVAVNCQLCDSKYHQVENCSLANYKPQRYKLHLQLRMQDNKKQDRKRYFRDKKQVNLPALSQIQNLQRINAHFRNKYQNIAFEYDKHYINDLEYLYKTTLFEGNTMTLDDTPTDQLRKHRTQYSQMLQTMRMTDTSFQDLLKRNQHDYRLFQEETGYRGTYIMSGLEEEQFSEDESEDSTQQQQQYQSKVYDTYVPSETQQQEVFTFEQKNKKQTTQEGFQDTEFQHLNQQSKVTSNNNNQSIKDLNTNSNNTIEHMHQSLRKNPPPSNKPRPSLQSLKEQQLIMNANQKKDKNNSIQEILSPCMREKILAGDQPSPYSSKRASFQKLNEDLQSINSKSNKYGKPPRPNSNPDQNLSGSHLNTNNLNQYQEKRRTSNQTSQLNSPFFKRDQSKESMTQISSKNVFHPHAMYSQGNYVSGSMISIDNQNNSQDQSYITNNNQYINYLQSLVAENKKIQENLNQNQLFLEFDMQKDFQIYFTAFNLSRLIKKFNENQQKHQKILEKRKSQRMMQNLKSKDMSMSRKKSIRYMKQIMNEFHSVISPKKEKNPVKHRKSKVLLTSKSKLPKMNEVIEKKNDAQQQNNNNRQENQRTNRQEQEK